LKGLGRNILAKCMSKTFRSGDLERRGKNWRKMNFTESENV
jgi:hypothetical protein